MVRPIWANVFSSALATITAAIIYLYPSPLVCNAGAFVIGFSAAGGILQLGISVMSEFFPKSKAKVTSIYMMMGGLANFVIPLITGYLSNIGLQYIIVLDFTFALLALVLIMDVTAKYELIGLMAYPIRHSLSPEMQNKALEKAGLPFTYMAFEVDNDSFAGAIEGLKEIKLFNRRDEFFDKALAFAQRVNENTDCVVTVTDLADQQAFAEALASADILTNGTKVGMKPLKNESLVNDISLLHP